MDDHLLVQRLCDAANQNDAANVGSLLGCRKMHSPSIDEPLLCSSAQVDRILNRLLSDEDGDSLRCEHSVQGQHADTIAENLDRAAVKALVISPSIYEAPWKAACAFVRYAHRHGRRGNVGDSNRSFLRSTVADIQSFLLQAFALWCEEERRETSSSTIRHRRRSVRPVEGEQLSLQNPRYWILELVAIAMEPLLAPAGHNGLSCVDWSPSAAATVGVPVVRTSAIREELWRVPHDLISTVVSLSNDLETSLLHAILDLIFGNHRSVRCDRLLPWIYAASELCLFLRDEDRRNIHKSIQKTLSAQPCPIPCHDLPGLAESILTLTITTPISATLRVVVDKRNQFAPQWQELILQLFSVAASTNLVVFSAVEAALEASLASFPSRALLHWVLGIISTSTSKWDTSSLQHFKQNWIEANVVLLVLRASQQSGSLLVAQLVAQAFGGTKGAIKSTGDDLNSCCWKHLVRLASCSEATTSRANFLPPPRGTTMYSDGAAKELRSVGIVKALRRMFDGVRYAGRGLMLTQSSGHRATKGLQGMCSLVFHSLFLDCEWPLQSAQLTLALERAKTWMHCANDTLQSRSADVMDLAAVVVILVCIYVEVPMARTALVRTAQTSFSVETDSGVEIAHVATIYSLIISAVLSASAANGSPCMGVSSDLDRLSDVFSLPVPLDVFCDLARALAPLASARTALLAAAQKRLVGTFPMKIFCRGVIDSSARVKCGLFALVVLLRTSVCDDIEIDAWSLLSDAIVENLPHLPLPARSWLFCQLKDSVVKKYLSGKLVNHLLRACLSRLLAFIRPDRFGREYFAYEIALANSEIDLEEHSEDIVGLFDLVFTLLSVNSDCLEDGTIEEEKSEALRRCRELLPQLLELYDPDTNEAAAGEGFGSQRAALPALVIDGGFPCYLAFYCLSLALRAVESGRLTFDGKVLPPRDSITMLLVNLELEELGEALESKSPPKWHSPEERLVGNCGRAVDNTKRIHIRLALNDAVIELLVGPGPIVSSDSDSSILLAKQLSVIVGRRRQLLDGLRGEMDNDAIVSCSQNKLAVAFEGFCSIVVPVLGRSISCHGEFSEFTEMLSATLDICDRLVGDTEPRFEELSLHRCLVCFRVLYTTLCEEKAAVRLIDYLESQRCEGGGKQVCRMSLDGPDDVDCVVRRVRLSVVRCVSCGLNDRLRCMDSETFEGEPRSRKLEYFLRFVSSITSDLRAGLEGASGGLTYDLFLSMIDIMDQCASVLLGAFASSGSIDSPIIASLGSVCQASSNALEWIMCNFALQQAAAFKKTLMLCVGTFPTIARRLLPPSSRMHLSRSSSIAARLFHQLALILKRKAELDSTPGTPWNVVVGKDHLGGKAHLIDEDDVSDISEVGGDTGDRQGMLSCNAILDGMERETILLQTERSWTWSLCCVLQAFEDDWAGSQCLEQDKADSIVELSSYYAARQSELAETLRSIGMLFQSAKYETKIDPSKQPDMTVCALALPSAAKTKLCATVDRIFIALKKSTQRIVSQFCIQSRVPVGDRSCRSFAEALSCLSAWLCALTDGAELSSGVQRWYLAEQRLAGLLFCENTAYAPEAAVLRRLPKLVFRLEDVDFNLRKLLRMIQGFASLPNKCGRSSLLNIIGSVVDHAVTEPTSDAFCKLLSDKVTFLEREQVRLEYDFGLSTADDQASGEKRSRTIDAGRNVKRDLRRRTVRSRNGVVDAWLQLDSKIGADEAVRDDAYADLEDFLVDG